MKSIITFILCLTVALGWSLPIQSHHAAVARLRVAGGGGGHTYLINEDFEGTGTPSGWFAGASADFDSTTATLAGAQSMRLNDTEYTSTPTINEAEIWIKFRFKVSALPSSAAIILNVQDSGYNDEFLLTLNTDGTLEVGGAASGVLNTADSLSAGTSYDIEAHYIKGTGTNATFTVGFVAAGGSIPSSGTKFASTTIGAGNANIDHILILDANCTNTDYDNFQVSTTQNP